MPPDSMEASLQTVWRLPSIRHGGFPPVGMEASLQLAWRLPFGYNERRIYYFMFYPNTKIAYGEIKRSKCKLTYIKCNVNRYKSVLYQKLILNNNIK